MRLIQDIIKSVAMPSVFILYLLIVFPAYVLSKQELTVKGFVTYTYVVDAFFYSGLLFFAFWALWNGINWIRDTSLRR